jgi:catechol 2,3-dioxygenase-like lactoylglutathione lyase family enzyme
MLTGMMFAKDVEVMRRFYAEGLGLVEDTDATTDGFVVLTGPGTRIALHAVPAHIAARITIDDPPAPRSGSAIKLLFATVDVAATRDRLARLGAQMFETLTDDAVDGADPEGNVFRICAAGPGTA